jgi:hypothetical protein
VTTWLNIMGFDATQLSRWDRLDGAAAVEALAGALRAAGLPDGQLEAPMRLLAQAEDLAGQARAAKDAARQRLEQANRALLAEGPDLARYGATLGELAPWLDEESAGMIGVMQAAARIRSNATQVTFALVPSLYAVLQKACADVVAQAANVPVLPNGVWAAPTTGEASTLAIRAGLETEWAQLTRLGDRWDAIHSAAQLLRESGQFQSQLMFACPTAIGVMFLGWEAALDGLPAVRKLPGPLRLRAAIDRDFRPGLYLAADHVAVAAEAEVKPKRKLFAALAGRSGNPSDVGDEFSA